VQQIIRAIWLKLYFSNIGVNGLLVYFVYCTRKGMENIESKLKEFLGDGKDWED
jgi:hypothetical protein